MVVRVEAKEPVVGCVLLALMAFGAVWAIDGYGAVVSDSDSQRASGGAWPLSLLASSLRLRLRLAE